MTTRPTSAIPRSAAPEARFCSQCGGALPWAARFCASCGVSVAAPPSAASAAPGGADAVPAMPGSFGGAFPPSPAPADWAPAPEAPLTKAGQREFEQLQEREKGRQRRAVRQAQAKKDAAGTLVALLFVVFLAWTDFRAHVNTDILFGPQAAQFAGTDIMNDALLDLGVWVVIWIAVLIVLSNRRALATTFGLDRLAARAHPLAKGLIMTIPALAYLWLRGTGTDDDKVFATTVVLGVVLAVSLLGRPLDALLGPYYRGRNRAVPQAIRTMVAPIAGLCLAVYLTQGDVRALAGLWGGEVPASEAPFGIREGMVLAAGLATVLTFLVLREVAPRPARSGRPALASLLVLGALFLMLAVAPTANAQSACSAMPPGAPSGLAATCQRIEATGCITQDDVDVLRQYMLELRADIVRTEAEARAAGIPFSAAASLQAMDQAIASLNGIDVGCGAGLASAAGTTGAVATAGVAVLAVGVGSPPNNGSGGPPGGSAGLSSGRTGEDSPGGNRSQPRAVVSGNQPHVARTPYQPTSYVPTFPPMAPHTAGIGAVISSLPSITAQGDERLSTDEDNGFQPITGDEGQSIGGAGAGFEQVYEQSVENLQMMALGGQVELRWAVPDYDPSKQELLGYRVYRYEQQPNFTGPQKVTVMDIRDPGATGWNGQYQQTSRWSTGGDIKGYGVEPMYRFTHPDNPRIAPGPGTWRPLS